MKQQLLIINRSRRRTPNLSATDRFPARFLVIVSQPTPTPTGRRDCPAINTAELSPPAQAAQVSTAVFVRPQT